VAEAHVSGPLPASDQPSKSRPPPNRNAASDLSGRRSCFHSSPGCQSRPTSTITSMQIDHSAHTRQRLPNRRACETFELTAGGLNYRATVGRFDDGQVSEVFLSNHKVGSQADTAAKDSAVVCSIALQYGVPLEVIRKALMRDSQGRPSGPLGVALDALAADDGGAS
jgi:hypothetical protein